MGKNEPAFPQISEIGDIAATSGGMTLRDYFAAKAMQALIPSMEKNSPFSVIAAAAYTQADKMLEERDNG